MRVLVLSYIPSDSERTRLTVEQHLHALERSDHDVSVVHHNTFQDCPDLAAVTKPLKCPDWLRGESYDAAILHYTFLAFHWDAAALLRWKWAQRWIRELDCIKIAIPQDEPDHAEMLDEWLFEWGVSAVVSVHFREDGPLYPLMRRYARIERCLPGYIDEEAARWIGPQLLPLSKRPFDVVYRARNLPFVFGSSGRMKAAIGERFIEPARRRGLVVDISTRDCDAVLGAHWLSFLASGRAVLGCEGGYSTIDWRGELKAHAQAILIGRENIGFETFCEEMPSGWDSHALYTMTPRHFDAILTRTCQVLVEGEYSGILQPDVHYIPVRRDLSNVDEVLDKMANIGLMEEMVERAYSDVYLQGGNTYRDFGNRLYDLIKALADSGGSRSGVEEHLVDEGNHTAQAAVEAVERQLVSARHQAEVLEGRLLYAERQIGEFNHRLAQRDNATRSPTAADVQLIVSEVSRALADIPSPAAADVQLIVSEVSRAVAERNEALEGDVARRQRHWNLLIAGAVVLVTGSALLVWLLR